MKHNSVFAAVRDAVFKHKLLSVGTVLCAAASVLEMCIRDRCYTVRVK